MLYTRPVLADALAQWYDGTAHAMPCHAVLSMSSGDGFSGWRADCTAFPVNHHHIRLETKTESGETERGTRNEVRNCMEPGYPHSHIRISIFEMFTYYMHFICNVAKASAHHM